jgi:hypothetical protein
MFLDPIVQKRCRTLLSSQKGCAKQKCIKCCAHVLETVPAKLITSLWEYAVLACLWRVEMSVCGGVVGVCAYVSVGVCSIWLSVAECAVCVLRSCGNVCKCVYGGKPYLPACGGTSCL